MRPIYLLTSMVLCLAACVLMPGCKRKAESGESQAGAAHGLDPKHDEHTDEVVLTAQAIERFGIQVEPVRRQVLVETFTAPARVSFNLERVAHVGTAVAGRVAQIKVRLGDSVKPGDVLLVIDSPEFGQAQSDYLQKLTALSVAEPAVDLARSAYERAKGLYEESQGIPLTEVQKREAEYKAAQGSVRSAQAAVTAAENALHLLGMSQSAIETLTQSKEVDAHYLVTAPIAGQVVEREATLGERVNPQREALVMLADMSDLWVLADVAEAKLSRVTLGSKARITVTGVSDMSLEGVVSYLSPKLDPATRTISVRVEVANQQQVLRPGMFAQAEIAVGAASEPVLVVPEEAVQTVEGSPAVFVPVVGEANTFAKRAVKVAPRVGRMVPVLEGLKEGEPVIVAGSFILKADLGKAGAEHED